MTVIGISPSGQCFLVAKWQTFFLSYIFYILINRQKKVKSDLGYQGTPQPRALKGWDGCTWKGREMCFRQHFAGVGG